MTSTVLSVTLAAGTPVHTGTERPTATSTSAASDLAEKAWQRQYRRLRAQTGVSWSLTAVGILGVTIPLAQLAKYPTESEFVLPDAGFAEIITIPIFAALTAAALVPAIIYTGRLVRHRRHRPMHTRLHLAPGGVVLRF